MSGKRKYGWAFALPVLILIFIRPQQAVDGVQRAMRMWYQGVAPALLPFLTLMPMITGSDACAAYEKLFAPFMRKWFRLPGAAAPAVIAAMVSGSPGGAAAICEIRNNGGISNAQAARIALATGGVSPAWLVLGVGCGMLGSKTAGMKLAAIQVVVQLFLLKMLEKVEIQPDHAIQKQIHTSHTNPVRSAVETAITVCGYMSVFGACGSVIASFAGEKVGIVLMAVLDLPSGAALIAENSFPGRMIALGCVLGFGGMCIAMQNMDKLRCIGVRWRDYIITRCVSAAICASACAIFFRQNPGNAASPVNKGNIYAVSLLAAALCALPVMKYISKTFYLNKSKSRGNDSTL